VPLLTHLIKDLRELVFSPTPQRIFLGPHEETPLPLQSPDLQAVLLEFGAQLVF
jgi:hypothetical protein